MSKLQATTTAAALRTLRQEISALEAEIRVLTDKCEVEKQVLAILIAQRSTLSPGTMKSAVAALNQKIDFSKAALKGFDSLLRAPVKRLEEAYSEVRKFEEEAQRAAESGGKR